MREARTAERVRALFARDDRVVVPAVDWDRTTRRVLTMDLIEGRRPAAAAQLRAVGLDPQMLVATGAEAMLRQIFQHGLFHADPHPGNLLVLEGNRVCFLDFGLFGRLTPRQRRRMGFLLWALVRGDYETVGEQCCACPRCGPGLTPTSPRRAR